MNPRPIHITCPKAIPPVLAEEVHALGYPVAEVLPAGVTTEGTMADAMRLNLHLRTGMRVLYLLKRCSAWTPDHLYRHVNRIPWERYLDPDGYFSVQSSVENPNITNTTFANLRCKDAIADRMRAETGRRPDSGSDKSRAVVFLYWKEKDCCIYLDTSGEPLSHRGYRRRPGPAPLRENLAAAIVLLTGWDPAGGAPFVNPMCGAGTLAIEAALLAMGFPAGGLRRNFGFMHLLGYDEAGWQKLRSAALAAARPAPAGPIIATDHDPAAVEAARANANDAGVADAIRFEVRGFADTPVPDAVEGQPPGAIVLNPPYGERLGERAELGELYTRIGAFLKERGRGYLAYCLTANAKLARRVRLNPRRKIELYNTQIPCRLLEYEIFRQPPGAAEGTRPDLDTDPTAL